MATVISLCLLVLIINCVQSQYHRRDLDICEVAIHKSNCSIQTYVTNTQSDLTTGINSLTERYKKLEHKLSKEMKQLSKRVLRGARKLESLVNEFVDTGKKGSWSRSGQCPEGFVTHDDKWLSCYMMSSFNATWYEAREICTALDSDLVSLNSVKEHFLVSFFIKNNAEYNKAAGWWTSGTYVTKTKQWVWASGLETRPFTFIKWAVNEPNEEHDRELQCVMMYHLDKLLWHDQICSDSYNFVCEKTMT
ncbi:CLC4G-like protein [Mya arenaria]|uniref:CLC4G-like protein n=1 Tax=Mya arenaria TaxID=6604 RepID=A0ABY7DJB5_MYAAR|nr:perlucin-like [Mya arenaria]WAQ97784.1 CLC4G-like protein [Mya arenaria]